VRSHTPTAEVVNHATPRTAPAVAGHIGHVATRLHDDGELSADDRRARRAALLAELAEARALRARVAPRRARLAKTREALRKRLFRYEPPPRRRP
jgi:hypothetical protein